MKKISVLVASVLIAGSFSARALADGVDTTYKAQAGITPDSILYPLDKAIDNLKITLTFNAEKKAQVIINIAQERLGESEVMADENKTGLADKALEEYNEKISEASDKLEETSDKDAASTDDKDQSKVDELEKTVQDTQSKSLEILVSIQQKEGDKASDVLKQVVKVQTEKKEAVANFVAKRHEFNDAKKELNMAKVALQKAQKSGDAEAIKTAQDELAQKQEAYNTAKSTLVTAFNNKQAAVKHGNKTEDEKANSDTTTTAQQGTTDENNTTEQPAVTNPLTNTTISVDAKVAEQQDKDKDSDNKDKNKDKKEKENKGKSGEEHGKSGQSNGNKR
jgi:hypothetical protein